MKKKFLTLGWGYYWLIFVFIISLASGILLTIYLPKSDISTVFILLLVWLIVLAMMLLLVFGYQITYITEEGILQKIPFGKQIFFKWEEIRKIERCNVVIFKFIYVTKLRYERKIEGLVESNARDYVDSEKTNMSAFSGECIRIIYRKSVVNAIKTYCDKEIGKIKFL